MYNVNKRKQKKLPHVLVKHLETMLYAYITSRVFENKTKTHL